MSSSKDGLYQLLLETSPFGVLFFVYGVCVDANPKAQQILGCDRKTLLGSSLDDSDSGEPASLTTFKKQLSVALQTGETRVECDLREIGNRETGTRERDSSETGTVLHLDIRSVSEGSQKEIVVTLYNAEELTNSLSSSKTSSNAIAQDSTAQSSISQSSVPQSSMPQSSMPQSSMTQGSNFEPNPVGARPEIAVESSNVNTANPVLAVQPTRETVLQKLTGMSGSPDDMIEWLQDDSADIGRVGQVFTEHRDTDITVEKDSEWVLYHDSLTGLPNRQALLDNISSYLEVNTEQPINAALMLIDLDHFKDINDSWGHNVGDQVLVKIARVLSQLVTEQTMLARMSGDEFLFFIPSLGGGLAEAAYRAQKIANSVRELVASPVFFEGNEFILTASIGISLLTDRTVKPERALQYADTAMYEAKRKGRNGFAFFDPSIGAKAQRQIGLNTRLRKAVDNQEFALYIQPQIAVDDGRLMGGEALLRWVNTDRVTNMPAEFIPPLEASGLIVDVGHWVIRTACENLRSFIDDGLWRDDMKLSVNVSPRQFKDPQFIDVIKHSISSYDIEPEYLNFEVTENLLVEDVEDTIKKMEAIKALGAQFSIDDFGVGYSSMIYLKRLPFDWLKIDRAFICNVHRDPDSRGIVEAILAVSRQYGLRVVAEGVEEQGSLDVLRHIGCESYQGALFSMPVPIDQFREMLAA